MAFDGHQTTFVNSLFAAHMREPCANTGAGSYFGGVVPPPMPGIPLQGQDATSYLPWSCNAHDDPYGLINCAQSNAECRKSHFYRKPTDNADCDGETDLQGLVSNILSEADSQDSCLREWSLLACDPVWAPKTLREELLQHFQSEVKVQHNHAMPPNHVTCNDSSKAQGQSADKYVKDFYQQPNGLDSSQQWLLNLRNGDEHRYRPTFRPQKLPPGLPVSNMGKAYLSQMQQSKYDSVSAGKDRGNSQPLKNFPDLSNSNVFRPQGVMDNPGFHHSYADQSIRSSTDPIGSEQHVPQHINQLVSSFQSFMTGEHDSSCRGDFPNMHRQPVAIDHEDGMVEQWKITSPAVATHMTPATYTPDQLMGKMGTEQMRRHGGVRNQAFKCDGFQDVPEFSPGNTEYFQQLTPFSRSFSLPSQYQNKMTVHRENRLLPVTTSTNRYSKHHVQQGQTQSVFQPQRETRRANTPGFAGDDFSTRHVKQSPAQNLDHLLSMQSHKSDVENTLINAGTAQHLVAAMHADSYARKRASMPVSYINFSCRPPLPNGGHVPGMDGRDTMSTNELAAFVSGMKTHRGENPYHGIPSELAASVLINEGRLGIQLYFYLTGSSNQWSSLEKERKKAEIILNKTFPGWRAAAVINTNLPNTRSYPTGVDNLIVNEIREQGRVESLLSRMELLNNSPLHINIHAALNSHRMAVSSLRHHSMRPKEIDGTSKLQLQRAHLTEGRESLLWVTVLRDLAVSTRKLRTALWNALQMTLPIPVKRQDRLGNGVDAATERCASPFGYSFKL